MQEGEARMGLRWRENEMEGRNWQVQETRVEGHWMEGWREHDME